MRSISLRIVFCLAILLATAGCSQGSSGGSTSNTPTSTPCAQASSIKGQIISVSLNASGNRQGSFLLDGSKEQNAAYNQAVIIVLTSTQIYTQQNGQCKAIPFSSLSAGQRVQVQTTSAVIQTAPPQIEASEILLLS
ncbi:MAG TPA: hypothetical protein VKV40_20245 [Ktedonobacteraceae bacterium]|nr:hypothetical protein [Ktedonobacteraceae bacterium]